MLTADVLSELNIVFAYLESFKLSGKKELAEQAQVRLGWILHELDAKQDSVLE